MADRTAIEWSDATWNPVTGCDEVSPGCTKCYAKTFAERWRGVPGHHFENGFDVQLREDKLRLPLSWRKPRKVFVNSMSDLFHKDVPDEYIARVFAVMALTPQHTYQVLTKRHARMRSLLSNPEFEKQVDHELLTVPAFSDPKLTRRSWPLPKPAWPLPNVHLGVSVENQKWADIRIPALVDTPAAVRFISAEPLLGPVDLSAWMTPISPMPAADAPKTWAEWTWPEWVPQPVREGIEGFWDEKWGRGPHSWIRDMHQQGAPPFGATVRMDDGFQKDPPQVTGRYVHAWNNIGRLVLADDPNRSFAYTSFGSKTRRQQQPINWVIVGGESGHGARAMHPDWARSLRDQCVAADVPFLMKQWGEWGPAPFIVRVCDPQVGWTGTDEELAAAKADSEARGATHVHTGNWYDEDGERKYWLHEVGHKPWSLERVGLPAGHEPIRRWGKGKAGRELDGREWNEMPS